MKFTLDIPNPCSENWNKMTPIEKGKHCAVCEKDLTDFRTLSNQAIYDVVASNQNVCGRFSADQLNTEFTAQRNFHLTKLGVVAGFTSLVAMVQPAIAQTSVETVQTPIEVETQNIPKSIQADSLIIKGKVSDEHEPLPFATVFIIKNDTVHAFTDFDGLFELSVPVDFFDKGEVYLNVNYVGYEPQKILITNETNNLEIQMFTGDLIGEVVIAKRASAFRRFIDLFRRKSKKRYVH